MKIVLCTKSLSFSFFQNNLIVVIIIIIIIIMIIIFIYLFLSYCFRLYHTQRSFVTIVELLASFVVCIFVVFPAVKPEVCNCFNSIAKLMAKNRYVIFQSTISSVFVFNMLIKTRASRGTGNYWSEF